MNLSLINLKKKIKNFLVLFLIYSFFIVLGDLVYSNFGSTKDVNYNCFQYFNLSSEQKKYHYYNLKKNCKATESQRTVVPYKVLTDKNGYRYSGKKRKNTDKNIAFIGDSFTYGLGVKFKDSFPGIIENNLKEYEIYNLGVPGYGIKMYYKRIQNFYNNKKKATHLFLTLDMTDVIDSSVNWIDIPSLDYPVLKSHRGINEINKWDKIKDSNFKGIRLLTFHIRNYLRSFRKSILSNDKKNEDSALKSEIANFTYTEIGKNNNIYLNKETFKLSLNYIDEYFGKISNLAKDNETKLYLVIFPWPENLIYGQKAFNWELYSSNLCIKYECKKVISLFSEFENIKQNNINWKTLIYIDDDVHLKKFGNSILANKILNEVIFN